MMNKIKQLSRMLLLLFFVAACSPQELDDYGLDSMTSLTDDQVSFTQTVSPTSDNIITFTNTTELPKIAYILFAGTWEMVLLGTNLLLPASILCRRLYGYPFHIFS